MNTFWCSNLKFGDKVIICTYGENQKYIGVIIRNDNQRHPVIRCIENESLSGAYTFRRGFKWGSTDIYIEKLD